MRTLVIKEMRRDMPKGAPRDELIRFHKANNLPLWAAGDIDLSSVRWAKKAWIFAEAAEDREADSVFPCSDMG